VKLPVLLQNRENALFNLNQLYIQQAESINPCEPGSTSLEGLSKLSLFKSIPDNLADKDFSEETEQHVFTTLLSRLDKTVYFLKKETPHLICWEVFAISSELEKWLVDCVDASPFDFLRWPEKHLRPPQLLVFDMDSTFIQIEVIDELARQHGVGEKVSIVTEAAMRGELDFSESLISRVACLEGLAESTINSIADNLPLSSGVAQLVEQSHIRGVKVAIVSGGFTPFVQRLKNSMELFEVRANNLEIKNEKLTGKVLGQIVDAQIKADFVNQLKQKLDITKDDILTIGDGANDLLMMNESGFSLAYRAKPKVQAKAKGRMNIATLDDLCCVFDW